MSFFTLSKTHDMYKNIEHFLYSMLCFYFFFNSFGVQDFHSPSNNILPPHGSDGQWYCHQVTCQQYTKPMPAVGSLFLPLSLFLTLFLSLPGIVWRTVASNKLANGTANVSHTLGMSNTHSSPWCGGGTLVNSIPDSFLVFKKESL